MPKKKTRKRKQKRKDYSLGKFIIGLIGMWCILFAAFEIIILGSILTFGGFLSFLVWDSTILTALLKIFTFPMFHRLLVAVSLVVATIITGDIAFGK